MGKISSVGAIIALITFVAGLAVIGLNWFVSGLLFAVSIFIVLFNVTWKFGGFLTNTTEKISKWSKDGE